MEDLHQTLNKHPINQEILDCQLQEFLSSNKKFETHVEEIRLLKYRRLIPPKYLVDPPQDVASQYLQFLRKIDPMYFVSGLYRTIKEIILDVKMKFDILDPSKTKEALSVVSDLGFRHSVIFNLPSLVTLNKLKPSDLQAMLDYYNQQHSNDITGVIAGIGLNKVAIELSYAFNAVSGNEQSTFIQQLRASISNKFPYLPANSINILGGICMVAGLAATVYSVASAERLSSLEIVSFISSSIQLALSFANTIMITIRPALEYCGETVVYLTDFLRPAMSTLKNTSFAFLANTRVLFGAVMLPLTFISLLPLCYEAYVDFKSCDYRRGAFNTAYCGFIAGSAVVGLALPWTLFISLPIVVGMSIVKYKWFKDPLDKVYHSLSKVQRRNDVALYRLEHLRDSSTHSLAVAIVPSPTSILELSKNSKSKNNKNNNDNLQLNVTFGNIDINQFEIQSTNGYSYFIKYNDMYLASGEKQKKFLFFEKHRDLTLQKEPFKWYVVRNLVLPSKKKSEKKKKKKKNDKDNNIEDDKQMLLKILEVEVQAQVEVEHEYTLMSENCRFLAIDSAKSKFILEKNPKLSFKINNLIYLALQLPFISAKENTNIFNITRIHPNINLQQHQKTELLQESVYWMIGVAYHTAVLTSYTVA
ncbi:hypothetical protein PPL_01002 [Heterostelium album PN500]|uniref:Uncharacterized protein n=1 Tax=Heterostelium pallidum (strain ATCC 26659 / Pp 5 / PN500) TaxID=670386 RepID=D3AXU5_HETP5|nr:hypothetical protein PPL_01002 [Heterostelium album PN500]EFA85772.1 hypothetical protein PPL_01002 [Heterostelium album PN500]|eukprot:XP_020437878.1 hypothetical protein PPL_01002 [Heterostelium album PN500]